MSSAFILLNHDGFAARTEYLTERDSWSRWILNMMTAWSRNTPAFAYDLWRDISHVNIYISWILPCIWPCRTMHTHLESANKKKTLKKSDFIPVFKATSLIFMIGCNAALLVFLGPGNIGFCLAPSAAQVSYRHTKPSCCPEHWSRVLIAESECVAGVSAVSVIGRGSLLTRQERLWGRANGWRNSPKHQWE